MSKVIVSTNAKKSILSIVNYISEDNLFYANKVQDYIKNSILLIWDFPNIWKILEDWIHRQIVEHKYTFKVIYRIKNETIYIVWIFREQENWK